MQDPANLDPRTLMILALQGQRPGAQLAMEAPPLDPLNVRGLMPRSGESGGGSKGLLPEVQFAPQAGPTTTRITDPAPAFQVAPPQPPSRVIKRLGPSPEGLVSPHTTYRYDPTTGGYRHMYDDE